MIGVRGGEASGADAWGIFGAVPLSTRKNAKSGEQGTQLACGSNSGLDGRSWHVLRYESLADGVEPVLFLNLLLNLAAVIIKVSQERHMQSFLSIIPYKDSGSCRRSRLAPSGTTSPV